MPPAATWKGSPNVAEQLLGLLSSPPAAFAELVPGGFATHWDATPASTPFATTADNDLGRLPQSLARSFAIVTCPLPTLPDMAFKGKLQPLGKSWAGHTVDSAWKLSQPNPPANEAKRLATLTRMYFMLDDRSMTVPIMLPGSGNGPSAFTMVQSATPTPFQTAFPGEKLQRKEGAKGDAAAMDALQRALFPALAASSLTPILPAAQARATFDATQPNLVAVEHIVSFAAHAMLWWLLVRDPDYLPGSKAPDGFNPFA